MTENIYKPDQLSEDDTQLTLTQLGPRERVAHNVLETLKEKIEQARRTLQDLQQDVEEKREASEELREQILDEAREEAESIRERARQEAETMVEEQAQTLEADREEAREEGYQAGQVRAREETRERLRLAGKLLREARRRKQAVVAEHTPTIIRIVERLASRVVRERVTVDHSVIERVLKEALQQVRGERSVVIQLHPEDVDRVRPLKTQLCEEHPTLEDWVIEEDSTLTPGGCRIRTDWGDLDANVCSQIEHLSQQLLDASSPEDCE